MTRAVGLILALVCAGLLQSCVSKKKDSIDDPTQSITIDWQDLTSFHDRALRLNSNRTYLSRLDRKFTADLRRYPSLIRFMKEGRLANPSVYGKGIYGKTNGNPHYITSRKLVPDNTRMYWVMVKILSEKYGCFMRAKSKIANLTRFRCRDGRHVEFRHMQGRTWQSLLGRQFDRQGRPILVKNHKIVSTR